LEWRAPAPARLHGSRPDCFAIAPRNDGCRNVLFDFQTASLRRPCECNAFAGTTWREPLSVTGVRILAARCVRVFQANHPHRRKRAQGTPGDGLTHGPPATKKAGGVTTGSARSTGIPCAMVYGLYEISPVSQALLPPSPARRGTRLRELSASVGAPGPHDFAVREHVIRLVTCRVRRIPLPTFVTIAKRPSCGGGTDGCCG
jgi:hypothetical protein